MQDTNEPYTHLHSHEESGNYMCDKLDIDPSFLIDA